MTRLVVLAAVLAAATVAVVVASRPGHHPPRAGVAQLAEQGDQGGARPKGLANASGCGSERAAVKHLTDGFVLPAATPTTIAQLVALPAPPVTPSSRRLPQERVLARLTAVHVVAAKQEADSDLHVIVATASGVEMNVEAPQAACDSKSPYAAQLASARAALDRALGHVSTSSYTPENATATIEGPVFFDVLHGQRGAPNGVELHPVTLFKAGP